MGIVILQNWSSAGCGVRRARPDEPASATNECILMSAPVLCERFVSLDLSRRHEFVHQPYAFARALACGRASRMACRQKVQICVLHRLDAWPSLTVRVGVLACWRAGGTRHGRYLRLCVHAARAPPATSNHQLQPNPENRQSTVTPPDPRRWFQEACWSVQACQSIT